MRTRRSSRRSGRRSATPAATTRCSARSTAARPLPGRQWIIDPIDGTTNFVRGVPIWAALHRARDRRRAGQLGVVAAPALAARGGGARPATAPGRGTVTAATPRRISVVAVARAGRRSPQLQLLKGWDEAGALDGLLALTRSCVDERAAYGDFWSYMLVAEGAVDIAGEPDLKLWDMAALVPIVTEAGGRFTALDGRPGPWHGTTLATNGLLHEAALGRSGYGPHIPTPPRVDLM